MNTNPMEVIDTSLLRGQLRLRQFKDGFHASTDTVLLAAAVTIKPGQTLLDVGCGVGSSGLCVTLKNDTIKLIGIDIQGDCIELARQNAALNGLESRCTFFAGNLLEENKINDCFFDVAMTNPPYQAGGSHTPSPDAAKALAHGESASSVTLEKWCKYLHSKLKNGGHLFMIHRADRLDEIVRVLTQRRWFGSLKILPIYSRAGDAAKRIIISARKERYAPLVIKSGLVMHEADGRYTPEVAEILDGMRTIAL